MGKVIFVSLLRMIVYFSLVFCIISCSRTSEDQTYKNRPVSGNESFELTSKQIDEFTLLADKGDAEAAFKLALYYDFVAVDDKKGFYWEKRAAENGHVVAQRNVGVRYHSINKNIGQSIFWLVRAARNGDSDAKAYLSKYIVFELDTLGREAIKGDPEAAYHLYEYFDFSKDYKTARIWLEKAAVSGNAEAKRAMQSEAIIATKKDDLKELRYIVDNAYDNMTLAVAVIRLAEIGNVTEDMYRLKKALDTLHKGYYYLTKEVEKAIELLRSRSSTSSSKVSVTARESSEPNQGGKPDENKLSKETSIFTSSTFGAKFVIIPSGTFIMGSNDPGSWNDESQHRVTISKPFFMQTTEVTQGQWKKIMGNNPSKKNSLFSNTDDFPVENVSWGDVQEFIEKLNRQEGTDKYRLPTEAEWEYAARAGTQSAFANGDITKTDCGNDPNLEKMGWYCGNSGLKTHPVARKHPNAWGLYDMHGNVWEWVQDWAVAYPSGTVTDPDGPLSGETRAVRGGSFDSGARLCRSANRNKGTPSHRRENYGFRLARTK